MNSERQHTPMKNIILIGMPGAGKSTVGVILAKTLGMTFVDTDIAIQERAGRLCRTLSTRRGRVRFFWPRRRPSCPFPAATALSPPGGAWFFPEKRWTGSKKRAWSCTWRSPAGRWPGTRGTSQPGHCPLCGPGPFRYVPPEGPTLREVCGHHGRLRGRGF